MRRRRWKLKEGARKDGSKRYSNSYDHNEKGMKATRAFGAF